MESRLVVAVIGAGMIATKAHIPAYQSLPDSVKIAAIVDSSEENAQRVALQADIPKWYTDAETMLRAIKPDLVSVCTPNVSHAGFVRLALEYGAHVLCEKPLALTWRETKELFDLAASKGKMLMACQTLRFDREYLAAKEMVDSGLLGKIYYAEFTAIRRRGIPKWGVFHRKELNGGGCLCDLGVHMIDAAMWLMGTPKIEAISGSAASYIARGETGVHTSLVESGAPAGVSNARPYLPEEFEVEEFAAGSVRFEDGLRMNFKTSWALNLPPQFNLSLAGSKAGLTLPGLKLFSVMGRYQADITPRVFKEGPHDAQPFSGHYLLIENAVHHLLHQVPLIVRPEQTLSVAAIIDAFYLASELNREVQTEEITGLSK